MSNEAPKGLSEVRNPDAAIDELYTDIGRVEAGESPDQVAKSWLAVDEFMKKKSAEDNSGKGQNRRRSDIAIAILKILRIK